MSTATVLPYSFGAVFGLAEGRCVVFGMLLFLLPTDRIYRLRCGPGKAGWLFITMARWLRAG